MAEATHIVGGEIYYDDLGGGNYLVSMKVYRDCINGIPPFDDPAFITVFNNDGSIYTTLNVALSSSLTVPPSNNSPCAPNVTGTACVEEATYTVSINLPASVGGYYIAYQRCCRNATILNLVNPGAVGTTYWEHIPGTATAMVNSSPRFSFRPNIYVCSNYPIHFRHEATDPDGDSLVYNLCTPFNGLDQCCPLIGSLAGPGCSTCPSANTPPPYVSVPFAAPYSASYPMASNPAININPVTGLLNGDPTILGQWVVGVCVSEYRHGVLIGTHHRDFQFNVISCPLMLAPAIEHENTTNNGAGTGYCNGFTLSYSNASLHVSSTEHFFWDFGDPNSTTDTSSLFNPHYTYTAIGVYTVTLIRNPGSLCPDTTTDIFHVYPLLSPAIITPTAQCVTNNSYEFNATGGFLGTGTFDWEFSSDATPQSSPTRSVTGVHFNAAGSYSVSFTVSENGCTATDYDTITVIPTTKASMGDISIVGCDPLTVTFPNLSSGISMAYLWKFSDGSTSTAQNPVHVFTPPGLYSVSLTAISNQYCMDTSRVNAVNSITVNPTPMAGFTASPIVTTIFDPDISFYNTSISEDIVSWYYDFNDGGTSSDVNPFHTYTTWGDYYVTQTVINSFGCPSVYRLLIKILPEFRFWIPNAFTPGNKDGLNDVFKPKVIGVEEYTFMIFDRWGAQVYSTNDPDQGWNGTYKGGPCKDDVYVWKCDFKNIVSEDHEYHVGHVVLVK